MNNERRVEFHLRAFFSAITIEPVIFLSALALALQSHTIQTLSLYKICHVTLEYPHNVCRSSKNKTIEIQTENIETNLSVYRSYLELIPSLILALILGAWSDSHGRKMPLLLSKFGYFLSSLALFVISLFDEWPPETLFIYSAVKGFTGGNNVFVTASISYIADISSPEQRTLRYGFVNAARVLAFPIGSALSGFAQMHWDFWPIFASATILYFICFIYLAWRINVIIPPNIMRVTNNQQEEQITYRQRFIHIFQCKELKTYFKVLFRPRDGHFRLWLLLVISANWFQTIPELGENHVSLLFYRLKYRWNQEIFGYFAAIGSIPALFGLLLVLPILSNKLNLSDPAIELIGNVSTVISPIVIAFSTKTWMVWAATTLNLFYAFVFPAMKAFTSKIIFPDEYGKVFALKDASEAFIPLFAGLIYTQLYKKTIDIFPGAIFLLSASFCSVSSIMFLIIFLDMKRSSGYTVLVESDTISSENAT